MKNFFQDGPRLSNTFKSDPLLKNFIHSFFPNDIQKDISEHLEHLGDLASRDMLKWAQDAENHLPIHRPYDPWGRRIDEIETSAGWKSLERLAAQEGVVATAYDRSHGAFSRVYQMALLYLYSPSSAIFSCPLAMTDGAARAIELYGTDSLKSRALPHLLSRDPQKFWTAGQWMTERIGGSDVSGTLTVAEKFRGDSLFGADYSLTGTKWFTSATTSQIALTLARPEGAPEGSKGLALYYLELRNSLNQLNNIEIHRLKDKLGTRALPTAELSLNQTPALQLGDAGEGVRRITSVLNITRIYNSICAVGHMRRCLDLIQDYSGKRKAFGKLLKDHPLHALTLQSLESIFQDCFYFSMFVAHLLGSEEVGEITASQRVLLRVLTPVLKLYTGKKCIHIASEVVEMFGGAGYIEDTGIPRLLRDAQVFSIWEGTTNVLSLDMLRAFEKEQAMPILREFFAKSPARSNPRFIKLLEELDFVLKESKSPIELESNARRLAFLVGDLICIHAESHLK